VPAAVLLHGAVEGHAVALVERLAHPPDALKPRALHPPALLSLQDDLQALLVVARHDVDGLDGAHDGHRVGALLKPADRRDRGAVEVAAGVEVKQVPHRTHAVLLGPHVGPLLADALHVADVLFKKLLAHPEAEDV